MQYRAEVCQSNWANIEGHLFRADRRDIFKLAYRIGSKGISDDYVNGQDQAIGCGLQQAPKRLP